jgi:type IV fimbrial biogenesis protein FimT
VRSVTDGCRELAGSISQNGCAKTVHLHEQAAGRTQLPLRRAAGNVPTMKKAPLQVSSPLPRSAGFTLLELMIAITVLAIIVGIGIPSFTESIRRNRLTSQTNALVSALAIARSEAVKRGTLVTICPASAAQDDCSVNDQWAANGLLVYSDINGAVGRVNTGSGVPAQDDLILQRLPAASTQKVNVVNAGVNFISYRGDGGANMPVGATEVRFVLSTEGCTNPDGARQVQVIGAGRASSSKVNCP